MVLNVSGLPILAVTVAVLALLAYVNYRRKRNVLEHPEPKAVALAHDLVHRGRKTESVRVIKRNTGWSRQLSQRFVDAIELGYTHLPDIVDDYPDLPRESSEWVTLLMMEGQHDDAANFISAHTGWPLQTAHAYLRRFSK